MENGLFGHKLCSQQDPHTCEPGPALNDSLQEGSADRGGVMSIMGPAAEPEIDSLNATQCHNFIGYAATKLAYHSL
jgi:hypothetical protein